MKTNVKGTMAIHLMACRDSFLRYCWFGFGKSGHLLVPFDGNAYIPFPARFDDVGMYIGVPLFGFFTGLGYEQSLTLFFATIMGLGLLSAVMGAILSYSSWFSRGICTLMALAVTWLSYYISDVYIAYGMAVLPLLLVMGLVRKEKSWYAVIIAVGIYWGILHYVRAYSCVAPLLVAVCTLITSSFSWGKRLMLVASLAIGFLLPVVFVRHIVRSYQAFAREHIIGHEEAQVGHTFWHPVYLGFGLLAYGNKDGIIWDDSYGYKKYFTAERYDNTLQNEAYEYLIAADAKKLFREQTRFVIWTICAKLGILLMYALLAMNVGLIALYLTWRREWHAYSLLLMGLSFNALFPLIALPLLSYSLGFIAMAFFIAAYALNSYRQRYGISWWMALYPLSFIIFRFLVRFL